MVAPLKVVGEVSHAEQPEPSAPSVEADDQADSSARPRLERARWLCKRAWRRAITEWSSLAREGRLMGKGKSYLGETIDEDNPACPSGAHIFAASREVRKSMAQALQDSVDAESCGPEAPVSITDRVLQANEDLGRVSGSLRRGLADDGHLSLTELLELRECNDALARDVAATGRDLDRLIDRAEGSKG
jgi:hypothetical protein